MKVRSSSQCLAVAALLSGLIWLPALGQISFAPALTRLQDRDQNQSNLPPEEQQSRSRDGLQDVSSGARAQAEQRRSPNRSSRATNSARAGPTLVATPYPNPTLTAAVATPTQPAPAPTPNVVAGAVAEQPAAKGAASMDLVTAALSIAAVLVLAALLYVLSKLRQLLGEGRAS